MPEFRVSWVIDIEAETPEEAARKARAIQMKSDSIATVFDVACNGDTQTIDLAELDAAAEI